MRTKLPSRERVKYVPRIGDDGDLVGLNSEIFLTRDGNGKHRLVEIEHLTILGEVPRMTYEFKCFS